MIFVAQKLLVWKSEKKPEDCSFKRDSIEKLFIMQVSVTTNYTEKANLVKTEKLVSAEKLLCLRWSESWDSKVASL